MAIVVHAVFRGVSKEEYDDIRRRVGWLERSPAGGLVHLTWWVGEHCHNLDGWESEAALNAYLAESLAPVLAEVGLTVEPEVAVHPAYEVHIPAAVTLI